MQEILNKIKPLFTGFNQYKYFKMRNYVITHKNLLGLYFLFKIKKIDFKNCASLGTHLGYGAEFKDIPNFPHGLNGIIVSHGAKIGKNCTIFHQVTIGMDENNNSPIIGDNCFIGAGAKIIGKITIGNNCKIGAGCIVVTDIPDNATVVMNKPRIIIKNQ